MINSSQYEKLLKEGYIESGSLVVKVDDITKIELTTEQVRTEASKQGIRQDKTVVLVDKQGRVKKLSSLMFGYNKKNVQLADGTFANSDELLAAMEEAITALDEGTIVVDRKGEPIDPKALIDVVQDTAGKVKIGERSEKVTNQNSRTWSVEGAHSDVEHKKGVVFLGGDGTDLKTGDYVSVDELMTALNEYVVLTPEKHEEQGEKKVSTVRKTYKNKLSKWLILAMILTTLLSGFRVKASTQMIDVPVEVKEKIEIMIEQDQLDFTIDGIVHELTYETIEEAQKRIASEFHMGDSVEIQAGDKFYEDSLLRGRYGIAGQGLRKEGFYQISGISIVCNGQVYDFMVDLSVQNPGVSFGDFINKTCKENNSNLDDVQIRFHIGSTSDYTRAGWIDITELIKEDTVEKEVTGDKEVVSATYNGVDEKFNGSTITVDTATGPVEIKVVDENGNLLTPGSTVIGSDGQEYKIGELDLSTIQVPGMQEVTKTVIEQQEVENGKKLTWRIQDCSLYVGIAPLIGAIAAEVANRKKNEESQKLPLLYEFDSEEEYQKFKQEFEEAKEKYEKSSGFGKMLKRVFYREEIDILQNLNKEQIQEIYSIIRNMNSESYTYQQGDTIEFNKGKIIVTSKEGKKQDITKLVTPLIGHIGRENQVEAEGLIIPEEEKESELRR